MCASILGVRIEVVALVLVILLMLPVGVEPVLSEGKPRLIRRFASSVHGQSTEETELAQALGKGRGMCAFKERRVHVSKYASKRADLDPWAQVLERARRESDGELSPYQLDSMFACGRSLSQSERVSLSYEVSRMDGRDPSTFGFLECGTIVGAHGVRGAVRVDTEASVESKFRLCEPGLRHLRLVSRRAPRPVILKSGRKLKCLGATSRYVVLLEGLHSRDAAAALAGATIYVRRERNKPGNMLVIDDKAVVFEDLIGAHVFVNHSLVGVVFDVVDNGLAHPLLEIELQRNRHCYAPLAPPIAEAFDPESRCIILNPPTGLLDLAFEYQEPLRAVRGFLPPATTDTLQPTNSDTRA